MSELLQKYGESAYQTWQKFRFETPITKRMAEEYFHAMQVEQNPIKMGNATIKHRLLLFNRVVEELQLEQITEAEASELFIHCYRQELIDSKELSSEIIERMLEFYSFHLRRQRDGKFTARLPNY